MSRIPLLSKVLLQVVHRFPPFGKNCALRIKGVSSDHVFEAAFLLPRGAHRLNACLYEPVPFIRVNREHSLHNDYGHLLFIGDDRPMRHQLL